MNERKRFMVEDAKIIFRNFAGAESQYNRAGDRNFAVILDPAVAENMIEEGWNVRSIQPREEGDEVMFYIPVAVSFKNRPPRIVVMTSVSRTTLDESMLEMLDYADIKTADLICNGYDWAVSGKTGTKAYLQTLFVTIEEDELERKYGYYGSTDTDGVGPGDDANE